MAGIFNLSYYSSHLKFDTTTTCCKKKFAIENTTFPLGEEVKAGEYTRIMLGIDGIYLIFQVSSPERCWSASQKIFHPAEMRVQSTSVFYTRLLIEYLLVE